MFDNTTVNYDKKWATVQIVIKSLNEDSVLDVHINIEKDITTAWVFTFC